MNYDSRRLMAPGTSRKRKDADAFHYSMLPKPLTRPNSQQQVPLASNRLLAGYMAYEFLTKGTLFGQKFDPGRAEAMPVSASETKRSKQSKEAEANGKSKPQNYAEVANLVKSDGVHIPGVVNPTQLARWIQM